MIYMRYWLKVGAAAAVAIAAGATLLAVTRPPALTRVAVLTESVPAMHAVSLSAVRWTAVAAPPSGAITAPGPWESLVASQSLAPGTILTTADLTAAQANGLEPGEVQWLVPVSAAASGLPAVGQRVDVWADTNGTFQPVAYGVRVIGLYSSDGGPVASPASTDPTASGPGLVALAVPSADLGVLLDVKSPYLVVDPNQAGFRLATASPASVPPASASPAAPAPASAARPGSSKTVKPAAHGG